jgi:hypothetical protein
MPINKTTLIRQTIKVRIGTYFLNSLSFGVTMSVVSVMLWVSVNFAHNLLISAIKVRLSIQIKEITEIQADKSTPSPLQKKQGFSPFFKLLHFFE